jgi:hypothetical protein
VKGALLILMFALTPGCTETRCEELKRVTVNGVYQGGGSLGEERLLRVGVTASSDQVLLTWTMKDGSRIRASYRVAKKLKR